MTADDAPDADPLIPTMDDVRRSDWEPLAAAHGSDLIDLGLEFWEAAHATDDPAVARVFELFSFASTSLTDSESWNEPFQPFMTSATRRSVVPGDLTAAETTFLAHAAELLGEAPGLQARLYDIAWTYGKPRQIEHAHKAIDAYTNGPLTNDSWIEGAEHSWRRATFLSRRLGKATSERLGHIETTVVDTLLGSTSTDGFLAIWLSEFLAHFGLAGTTAADIARHLHTLAELDHTSENFRRSQDGYRAAALWFVRAEDSESANASTVALAQAYVGQADNPGTSENVSNLVASTHLERAVATLRSVPNSYRAAHGLDTRLEHLKQRLRLTRKESLNEMIRLESDPINITDYVQGAKALVSGHTVDEALLRFALVLPLTDAAQARTNAIEAMSKSVLSSLFGGETLSADGRKVASTLGGTFSEDDSTAIFNRMVKAHQTTAGLGAQARVLPALETLTIEHNISKDLVRRICAESPVIPADRQDLWAAGLFAGFDGDYATAVHILVPQLEALVRYHLNDHGVSTLLYQADGTEAEKSLGPLLATDTTADLFTPAFQFELQALLTESHGANMRNAIAHGLLTDATSWTTVTAYVWWLMFRLCYIPFWNLHST